MIRGRSVAAADPWVAATLSIGSPNGLQVHDRDHERQAEHVER
jgi:hypothetical protein